MTSWTLTTVQITDRDPKATDVKALHDRVIVAALAGEPIRPVLWATPRPRVLIVRHDRPIQREDWTPGWAVSVSHAPYWLPSGGDTIDAAVVMDAGTSGQSHAQWRRQVAECVAKGGQGRAEKKPHRVRSPETMAEVLAARLAGILGPVTVEVARSWHLVGHRVREGRVQHSNHTLLRVSGTVLDAPALHALMAEGVGRNKSFGCGLILARPSVAVESAC